MKNDFTNKDTHAPVTKGEGTERATFNTSNGKQDVAKENGLNNPYQGAKQDEDKEITKQRINAVADAIKQDDVTVDPNTGRPISSPKQTDGYADNLNNPYSTAGKTVGPTDVDEVAEMRENALKAEMNGSPANANELRKRADELEAAQKVNKKHDKEEGVTRK